MSKAYVDTTILTDALLKTGDKCTAAKKAINSFDITELPVYAIKEFKAGPLNNFVWMHNKLSVSGSFHAALLALHGMSRTPKRYTTSTAIEALVDAQSSIAKKTSEDLSKKYGKEAFMDNILCDEYRLVIKTAIKKAWKRRRLITTDVSNPLTCYKEIPPVEERGLLSLKPTNCGHKGECCMAAALKSKSDALIKLKNVVDSQPEKPENKRRSKALRELIRKPKSVMNEKSCRDLGDAIFSFFAPDDAVILTTNTRDHEPLAKSLGKVAMSPE